MVAAEIRSASKGKGNEDSAPAVTGGTEPVARRAFAKGCKRDENRVIAARSLLFRSICPPPGAAVASTTPECDNDAIDVAAAERKPA